MRPFLGLSKSRPRRKLIPSPEDHKTVKLVIRCILCACCTGTCPVMSENPDYVGPCSAGLGLQISPIVHKNSQFRRAGWKLNEPNSVRPCVNHYEIYRVCPKSIPITKGINFMKREIKKNIPESGK